MLNNLVSWCSIGLNILVLIVSIAGFLKVIKNDLTHVQKSLEDLTFTVKEIDRKIDKNEVEIAAIKANCAATHRND
jgi:uncharacterized protein YoxC